MEKFVFVIFCLQTEEIIGSNVKINIIILLPYIRKLLLQALSQLFWTLLDTRATINVEETHKS